ncbi:hypothetical protein [Myroides phaeus]|uniref:Uncharacterized protein n=1 Tax=Myroides phaeus TaxID=702745 RepID=A0A1G8EF08_9FLAO|nr:hypothetical protein [Myroides phaeus]SDH68380.1 hypothetical protein SAMN05421818_11082 [Myroides phaeus]
MKKSYIGYAGLALVLSLSAEQAHAQQGFGTDKPHKSAAVDITSPKRGLLIPRVGLVKTTNGESPINGPAQSLMVYNENTHEDVTPGYYYWDNDRWVRFAKQSDVTEITLVGDAVGKTGKTKVVAIQGVSVIGAPTIANQVLMYDGTSWTPTTITASQLSDAKNLSAADGDNATIEVVTGGLNATLVETSLRVKNESITSAQIKNGEVKTEDLADKNVTAGKLVADPKDEGKVAVVQKDGSVKYENLASSNVIGQDVTAASDKVVLSEGAKGAALKVFTIDVDEKKLSLQNIGGKVTNDQITAGSTGQVLITDGTTTKWVDQSVISPTTNTLTKKESTNGNTIVSNVNGKSSELSLIESVINNVDGTNITTSVNGVTSSSVDLGPAIQAGQKTVEVVNGTNTTVTKTPAEGGKHTTYAVNVSQEAIQGAQKTTTVVGTEKLVTVTPTVNNNNTEYKVSINKEEILKDQVNTVVRAGNGVIVSDGKATPEKDGKEVFYDVAIDTNGATKGQVLTVEGEGDNKTVKWTTPAADKDTNIYNVDGTLAGNRTVNMDRKSLSFKDGDASIRFYNNKWGQNETSSENSIQITSTQRSTLQLTSLGRNFYVFQDPNSVGQISSSGGSAGLEFSSNVSGNATNSGIRFSLDRRVRMSLDKDDTFKVGLLNYGAGELQEAKRETSAYNALNVVHGHVKIDEINEIKGTATDNIVVADSKGVLKTIKALKAAMPKFFYMPSVVMPTAADQISAEVTPNVTYANGIYTVDLYANYTAQFGSPRVSSEANFKLPVLPKEELIYNVTWYDSTVFTNVNITKEGKLTYKISPNADVTIGSFMNIVFAVKE